MSIYIYKQCPDDRARGTVKYSSCASRTNTQQQFKDIATWYRDMGDQITATANAWGYFNTMRGVYYTEWKFSGTLYASAANTLCSFSPRSFTGSGGSYKTSFTACGNNCTSAKCSSQHLCPPANERNGTIGATVEMGDWIFDNGVPLMGNNGRGGPDYNSEVHWTFPKFCFDAGPCTTNCICNPAKDIDFFKFWRTNCIDRKKGEWSFGGNGFNFSSDGYWINDANYPCGYCWYVTKPCDPPRENEDENPCCCNCEGGSGAWCHDIWSRWQMTVTITGGPKSTLRCAV